MGGWPRSLGGKVKFDKFINSERPTAADHKKIICGIVDKLIDLYDRFFVYIPVHVCTGSLFRKQFHMPVPPPFLLLKKNC